MSKSSSLDVPGAATLALNRRKFLSLAPSAAIASTVPVKDAPRTGSGSAGLGIGESLAALWDQVDFVSASVVKASSAAAIDAHVLGCNVGLIAASRPEFVRDEDRTALAARWPKFGVIRVEARLSEEHGLEKKPWVDRWSLLIGGAGPDNGSLKGFLRADGALCGKRVAFYKLHDDRNAYLVGTRGGVVPRRRQVVCIGQFKAAKLPDYIKLLRGDGDQITVEAMRFPIPPTFFRRRWQEW